MSQELIRLTNLVMEFDGERILDSINLYINDRAMPCSRISTYTTISPSACALPSCRRRRSTSA